MFLLHSEVPKTLCSLSCPRPSKLFDLNADSRGGPKRLSEPDAVELNLMERKNLIRESEAATENEGEED